MKKLALKGIWCLLIAQAFANDETKYRPVFEPYSNQLETDSYFEQFNYESLSDSSWVVSRESYEDGTTYEGSWSIEPSKMNPGFEHDKGLVMKTPAARHGIWHKLDKPITNDYNDLIVQYEIKLQNGLDCGGTYIKLFGKDFKGPLNKDSNFLLMFGPDQCGMEDKIHLILNRYNPVLGSHEEHALRTAPMSRGGHFSNLYTLILHQDQSFEIRVNGEVVKAGGLLDRSKFEPPFEPPKEIDDPDAERPADWDDRRYIPDPNHPPKPKDYDEIHGQPRIPDPDAVKPDDWLDDVDPMIPDPEAYEPEDWNEETDGKWIPPIVPNPKCIGGKCGTWYPPTILNPNFKGRWNVPLILNTDYNGPWSPKKPNPHYFNDERPADLEPIGAIGFELWTMTSNILFDNIYIGHSIEEAEHIGNTTFLKKQNLEGQNFAPPESGNQPLPPPPELHSFLDDDEEFSLKSIVSGLLLVLNEQIVEAVQTYEEFAVDPLGTILTKPMQCVVYSCAFLSLFTFVFGLISAIGFMFSSPAKPRKQKSEKTPASQKTEVEEEVVSTGSKTSHTSAARRKK